MTTHWSIFIKGIISINYLTLINDINQTKPFTSMTYDPTISQIIKPLASMTNHWHQWQHDPTISPFGIDGNTNIDVNSNNQLLMSTCRQDTFFINSKCDYLSTSISPINRHQSHQCDYLSTFDINGKGPFSSLGLLPLSCCCYIISPLLRKGYQSDAMLKIHRTYSPCDHCSPWNYASMLFLQI